MVSPLRAKAYRIQYPQPEIYGITRCPGCGRNKTLDIDQFYGRVSTWCKDIYDEGQLVVRGCGWHLTVDWSKEEVTS